MGISFKYLSITDDKLYEIPKTKISDGKMFKIELAGKTVLNVGLYYEVKDRKPFKVIRFDFNRVSFDKNGVYDYEKEFLSGEGRREMAYVSNFHDNGDEPFPLPIPKALASPTEIEINTIKEYLNRKYPSLLNNSPNAIEIAIMEEVERYQKKINRLKKSHKRKHGDGSTASDMSTSFGGPL